MHQPTVNLDSRRKFKFSLNFLKILLKFSKILKFSQNFKIFTNFSQTVLHFLLIPNVLHYHKKKLKINKIFSNFLKNIFKLSRYLLKFSNKFSDNILKKISNFLKVFSNFLKIFY